MAKRKRSDILVQEETTKRRQRKDAASQKVKAGSGKKKKEKDLTNFVQDYIPIKDIKYGIIETTDGRYVKIVEVEPINFMLRSAEEQNNIIASFAMFFKVANTKLQFKSISKKADSSKHIETLKRDMKEETSKEAKELAKAYIKLVKEVGNQEALTRRFFFIFEYEPFEGDRATNNYEEIYNNLMSAAQTFKSYMQQCGNSVKVPKDESVFLGETLYAFFNRRSSIDEPFKDRVNHVVRDTMRSMGRNPDVDAIPNIPVVNYIAPRGLDLSHISYIIMDGMYYSFYYIKPDGYNRHVMAGWLSSIVNAGEGIDVDIHFHKEPRAKTSEGVARKIRLNTIKMKETYDTQSDYEELKYSIQSGYYIKTALANNEELFYMSVFITVSAKTRDGLANKKRILSGMLRSSDILVSECKFRQEQALNSVMPLNKIDKELFAKSKRNVMTTGAASTYMFTAFEMSDENGILLGVNQHNSSLCILDIFNSKIYKNANLCILGTSGAGKTFTEQLMALRMRMKGIQVFILAPLKGHEFRRACVNVGGQYVKISVGSPHCINIMEIRTFDTSSDKLIEGEDAIEEDSYLARKLQQLSVFFSLLIPDMNYVEQQNIEEALIDAYARKGITHDNDSLFKEEDPTQMKTMPVLGDVYNILQSNPETQRLASIMARFVKGSAQSFNRQTNVDLDNKYIVMDISELKKDMKSIGTFIALDYIWDKVKEDRTAKKAIFIDETWILIGADSNKFAAEFVLEIFKIIRGYGGAAIAATQDLSDFYALEGGKYGKGIVNNSETKIILNLKVDEARTVRQNLKLSKAEYRSILNFSRGQALIACSNNKVTVSIKPSETEKNLITTDRAELAAQAEKKKEEARREEKLARDQALAARKSQLTVTKKEES